MSEELKTLKDLEVKEIRITKDHVDGWYVRTDKLKAEAVKWVKDCSGGYTWEENEKRCEACKQFIEFFNLTSEDLK